MNRAAPMRIAAFLAMAAVLCALGCESLMDPRAWGSGGNAVGGNAVGGNAVGERDAGTRAANGTPAPKGPAATAKSSAEVSRNADTAKAGAGGRAGFASDRGPEAMARRAAEGKGGGAAVIKAVMARIEKGTVLKGSCFDFVSAVYADAGFPADKLAIVFSGKESGPFADPALLQPGDWVYFTHMYSATLGHSAVFVSWIDFGNRTALTADYPGNGRAEPGRYRVADLYKVWGIRRAAP